MLSLCFWKLWLTRYTLTLNISMSLKDPVPPQTLDQLIDLWNPLLFALKIFCREIIMNRHKASASFINRWMLKQQPCQSPSNFMASERKAQKHELQTHIFMLHVFKQSELPVGPLRKDLGLEGPVELLDGDLLLGFVIDSWTVTTTEWGARVNHRMAKKFTFICTTNYITFVLNTTFYRWPTKL